MMLCTVLGSCLVIAWLMCTVTILFSRAHARQEKALRQKAELGYRAFFQNELFLAGDPRGFYGDYPVPEEFHVAAALAWSAHLLPSEPEPVVPEAPVEQQDTWSDPFIYQTVVTFGPPLVARPPLQPGLPIMVGTSPFGGLPVTMEADLPPWMEASRPETLTVDAAYQMLNREYPQYHRPRRTA
jgi:hypothetical protein